MIIDENKLINHLKELGVDKKGIEEIKNGFKTRKYQPSYHDVEKFYKD